MKWLVTAGTFVLTALAGAQSKAPAPNTLLQQLKSPDWTVRANALAQLAVDAELQAPGTRRALVELLDRENHLMRDPRRFSRAFSSVAENEGWAEYYSTLLGQVDSFVDPNDVATVSILVQSAYNGDSPFAVRLGTFGQTVVPALLDRARDRKHSDSRSEAYEVLGYVLQQHRLGQSRTPLSTQAVRDIENILRAGLRDPKPYVRSASIQAVMAAGDVTSLPILEKVRASDPWFSAATNSYSIRARAEKAIAAIKEHPLGK